MASTLLRIKVQLNDADLLGVFSLVQARFGTRPKCLAQIFNWCVVLPAVPLLPFLLAGAPVLKEAMLMSGLVIAMGIMTLLSFRRLLRRVRRVWMNSLETRRLKLPTTIEATAEGIRVTTPLFESWYAWSLVSSVERVDHTIYVWLGQGDAIIIPERSFESAHTCENFFAMAEQSQRQFAGARLACPKCDYDLRGDSRVGCPECGWGREQASS